MWTLECHARDICLFDICEFSDEAKCLELSHQHSRFNPGGSIPCRTSLLKAGHYLSKGGREGGGLRSSDSPTRGSRPVHHERATSR